MHIYKINKVLGLGSLFCRHHTTVVFNEKAISILVFLNLSFYVKLSWRVVMVLMPCWIPNWNREYLLANSVKIMSVQKYTCLLVCCFSRNFSNEISLFPDNLEKHMGIHNYTITYYLLYNIQTCYDVFNLRVWLVRKTQRCRKNAFDGLENAYYL